MSLRSWFLKAFSSSWCSLLVALLFIILFIFHVEIDSSQFFSCIAASIMRCETLHNFCAVTDVDVSSLMSDIENELHWISLFRLFFMFIWSVSVWASILLSLQCADAQSAIKTNYMHRQLSCSSLHFQVLLHVSSLNVTSAWLLKIECSHA